ncbi:hypothetical protein PHYPSEUDO_001479 [Phytophthora pseudosyringae]|uniref:Uncharacterized protein n=1 Tax=Phytophthora pseudosyringae TaxID=221518 RepID=A0A8T1VZU8_9STRA|nr:hypothetical protein PHYPSEUDO_001479 [Phytophthora pseudosyringae]
MSLRAHDERCTSRRQRGVRAVVLVRGTAFSSRVYRGALSAVHFARPPHVIGWCDDAGLRRCSPCSGALVSAASEPKSFARRGGGALKHPLLATTVRRGSSNHRRLDATRDGANEASKQGPPVSGANEAQ